MAPSGSVSFRAHGPMAPSSALSLTGRGTQIVYFRSRVLSTERAAPVHFGLGLGWAGAAASGTSCHTEGRRPTASPSGALRAGSEPLGAISSRLSPSCRASLPSARAQHPSSQMMPSPAPHIPRQWPARGRGGAPRPPGAGTVACPYACVSEARARGRGRPPRPPWGGHCGTPLPSSSTPLPSSSRGAAPVL